MAGDLQYSTGGHLAYNATSGHLVYCTPCTRYANYGSLDVTIPSPGIVATGGYTLPAGTYHIPRDPGGPFDPNNPSYFLQGYTALDGSGWDISVTPYTGSCWKVIITNRDDNDAIGYGVNPSALGTYDFLQVYPRGILTITAYPSTVTVAEHV